VSAVLALRAAQKAGAHVFVRDGHLVVQSQGHLPHDVMAELQANRDRLVEIMTLDKTPVAAVQGDPRLYMPWLDPNVERALVLRCLPIVWPANARRRLRVPNTCGERDTRRRRGGCLMRLEPYSQAV